MADKKPVIIRTRIVPKRFCVNFFGLLLVRNPRWIDATVVNHERIHTAQMRELLFLPFYVIYFFEWLWRLVQLHNWFAAYRAISFEREAYANGSDFGYLARRRHFAQWRKPLAEKR